MNTPTEARASRRLWPQFRRFLIFQLKLYIDAFRDFILSLLSLGAFILDVISRTHGPDSHFERVLKIGRRTERAINLFEQHDPDRQERHSIDAIIRGVEGRFKSK